MHNLSKAYQSVSGEIFEALKEVSFSLDEGEFLTVVGQSGSGKTTLLNIIAGMEEPSSGQIEFQSSIAPPRIGYVFQSDTIFPWRNVEQNLTYALEMKGVDITTRKKRAKELTRLVGLSPERFLSKYPKELSGGEKRKVAIGMALATDAKLMLFDEPTSQIDYLSRMELQEMILNLWEDKKFSAILVTHDLDEAVFLGNKVLALNQGRETLTLKIDLPHPRTRNLKDSEKFINFRNRLISSLEHQ